MLRPRSLAWEGSCVCKPQHLAYIQTLRWLLRWNQGCLWVSTHLNAGLLMLSVAEAAFKASRCRQLQITNDRQLCTGLKSQLFPTANLYVSSSATVIC